MRIQTLFVSLFFSLFIVACQSPDTQTKSYVGVSGQDTAYLTLTTVNDDFYGKYEIRKSTYAYRKGNIQGKLKGDTLMGDFYFTPYGAAVKKRVPLALLQVDTAILVGKGVISSYMGIPFFVESIPIDYEEPEFVLIEESPAL